MCSKICEVVNEAVVVDGKPFNSWNGRTEAKPDATIIAINVMDFVCCILHIE